jgi:hypothetical protein
MEQAPQTQTYTKEIVNITSQDKREQLVEVIDEAVGWEDYGFVRQIAAGQLQFPTSSLLTYMDSRRVNAQYPYQQEQWGNAITASFNESLQSELSQAQNRELKEIKLEITTFLAERDAERKADFESTSEIVLDATPVPEAETQNILNWREDNYDYNVTEEERKRVSEVHFYPLIASTFEKGLPTPTQYNELKHLISSYAVKELHPVLNKTLDYYVYYLAEEMAGKSMATEQNFIDALNTIKDFGSGADIAKMLSSLDKHVFNAAKRLMDAATPKNGNYYRARKLLNNFSSTPERREAMSAELEPDN